MPGGHIARRHGGCRSPWILLQPFLLRVIDRLRLGPGVPCLPLSRGLSPISVSHTLISYKTDGKQERKYR